MLRVTQGGAALALGCVVKPLRGKSADYCSATHPSSFLLHPSDRGTPRRAFTLVELLIVVAIMVVVAAFLIPAVKPALQDRKIRESARLVNVFFAGAQARAIERGRPVGVWLERNPTSPDECIQLFMAEAPPPYTGDILGARASVFMVTDNMGNPLPNPVTGRTPFFRAAFGDLFSPSVVALIKQNDQIKFDYKGTSFPITAVNPPSGPNPPSVDFDFNVKNNLPPVISGSVPYQIFRQPTRTNATSFTLPSNTSINLFYSGASAIGFGQVGNGGAAVSSPQVSNFLLVTFNPSGRLEQVTSEGVTVQATESLYFFVARNDKVDAATKLPDIYGVQNLEDQSNMWVAIGHNTGAVLTVENVNTLGMPTSTPVEQRAKVAEARRFAREKTAMGGR